MAVSFFNQSNHTKSKKKSQKMWGWRIILGLALQTFLSVDAGHLSPELLKATKENIQRYELFPLF
jgi:hypothetical protein